MGNIPTLQSTHSHQKDEVEGDEDASVLCLLVAQRLKPEYDHCFKQNNHYDKDIQWC